MTRLSAQLRSGPRPLLSTLVLLPGAIALLCSLTCIGAERATVPAEAGAIFARSKDALLQVCTMHNLSESTAGYGSGFIASADGLVITNYHVISQYALEPDRYRIEFVRGDGSRGRLKLLAIDIANDLALLKMPGDNLPHLRLRDTLPTKGDRGYSMGNPLDLGMTIVEGTYNGPTDAYYYGRIHFTGPVNSGMSGGPAVGRDGTVFGVNVARDQDGQLVSFLVPVDHARQLLAQAERFGDDPKRFVQEVAAQLLKRQAWLMKRILASPLPTSSISRYTAPGSLPGVLRCWGNSDRDEDKLYWLDTKWCMPDTSLYVSNHLLIGDVRFMHRVLKSKSLGTIRFAALVELYYGAVGFRNGTTREDVTGFECHDGFVNVQAGAIRTALCVRAYRKFEGLYDFRLRLATLDSTQEALVSTLELDGVGFDQGVQFAQRFVEATSWTH